MNRIPRTVGQEFDPRVELPAAKMLLKWRHHEYGISEWDADFTFAEDTRQPCDYLAREELERSAE